MRKTKTTNEKEKKWVEGICMFLSLKEAEKQRERRCEQGRGGLIGVHIYPPTINSDISADQMRQNEEGAERYVLFQVPDKLQVADRVSKALSPTGARGPSRTRKETVARDLNLSPRVISLPFVTQRGNRGGYRGGRERVG